MDIIQETHKWTANILLIIFIYSSMMWYWIANDSNKIDNISFRVFIFLEKFVSGVMFVLGIGVLVSNPEWLTKNGVLIKMMLGIITIGLIHLCAAKTKQYLDSKNKNTQQIKTLNILRAIAIILLMTVYTTGTMIRAFNDRSLIEEVKKIHNNEN